MITIKDVAREAGVSCSTVSVVLGNRTTQLPIAEKTRRKVQECALKIGYRRNALASQMISGRTNFIAMVTEMIRQEFTYRSIAAATEEAELNGFYLKLLSLSGEVNEADRIKAFDLLLEQRPAGIIIYGESLCCGYLIQTAGECGIPVVVLDSDVRLASANIISDDVEGIRLAMNYLYGFDHRKIGFFSDPLMEGMFTQIRYKAFQETALELGLEVNPEWCYFIDYYHNQHIREGLAKLFSGRGEKPTAFCCASDPIALKVLTSLLRLGIRVPEDVSLIGYGGIHFTELTDPAITTVAQDFESMGRNGIKYIVDFLNNKNKEHLHEVIPTCIIKGESVAKVKKGERE